MNYFPLNESIFERVGQLVASNLDISPEVIYPDFMFNKIINRLAEHRQKVSGDDHLLYYIEAANLYFDIIDEFKIDLPYEYIDRENITVGELTNYIQEKCGYLV
jgi:acyl carrier protein